MPRGTNSWSSGCRETWRTDMVPGHRAVLASPLSEITSGDGTWNILRITCRKAWHGYLQLVFKVVICGSHQLGKPSICSHLRSDGRAQDVWTCVLCWTIEKFPRLGTAIHLGPASAAAALLFRAEVRSELLVHFLPPYNLVGSELSLLTGTC